MADASIEIPDFELPEDFGESSAVIQARMIENLPDGIDKTEAGFAWDLTKPAALEIAEFSQYKLALALRMMFSLWAVGSWLDWHATENDLSRKAASYAVGVVTVTGTAGTVIPAGFEFATEATVNSSSKIYVSDEAAAIGEDGTVDIAVTAAEAGVDYNTGADTVCLMVNSISGIVSITNAEVITGGADEETDDELRQRVIYAERNGSFTGCDGDYVRWALEVSGVGGAKVYPEWNGAGTVKVLIEDADGNAANDELCEKVYDYIVSPDDRSARLAPIGAEVTVASIEFFNVNITYSYTPTSSASDDDSKEAIEAEFEEAAAEYINVTARESLTISYNKIYALLAGIEGVKTVDELTIIPLYSGGETEGLSPGEIYEIADVGVYPVAGEIAAA